MRVKAEPGVPAPAGRERALGLPLRGKEPSAAAAMGVQRQAEGLHRERRTRLQALLPVVFLLRLGSRTVVVSELGSMAAVASELGPMAVVASVLQERERTRSMSHPLGRAIYELKITVPVPYP